MWAVTLAVLLLLCANLSWVTPVHARTDDDSSVKTAPEARTEKYFVVTLRSSLTPISDKQAKRDFPDRPVYLLQSKAFGKNTYYLRVGLFENASAAEAFREQVLATYPAAHITEIASNEYAIIQRTMPGVRPTALKIEAKTAPAVPAVPVPAPVREAKPEAISPKALYVLQLKESEQAITSTPAPLPKTLKDYRLYATQTGEKTKQRYQLKLGFFENEQAVYGALKQLKPAYPGAKVIRVTLDEQKGSLRTALGAPAPAVTAPTIAAIPTAPAIPPAVTPVPATSFDSQAQALLDKGRAALARGNNAAAITALDQLLRLPPNRYSQDAQEYIGLARERAGETVAARKEYELYLRLYPAGEATDRVRQRLAALDTALAKAPPPAFKTTKPRVEAQSTVFGSFSQYYYHGASKLDTTTLATAANVQSQAGLTRTDQSALISNLNLTQRYRSEDYDNRFVLRDTHTKNFLQGRDDINRLSALYYELKDRKLDYSARMGRQPGGTSGVLGRFDGVLAGYNFSPKWRANVVGGKPVDNTFASKQSFQGAGVDIGPFAEHWGGGLYTIEQTVDGVTDRHAVGSELRYFSPAFTMFGLFDYDVEFQAPNITLIQGNWTASSGTTTHVLFDRRKTPSLMLTNALLGESDTSIKSQLMTKSYEELKQQARNLTSTTDLYSVGVSQPFATRWQAGLDVQSAHTSSTVGSPNMPAQPDTGTIYTYSGNLIGSGVFTQRDINVINVSHIDAPTYAGNSFALTNRLLWGTSWSLDTTLHWYKQHDTITNTDLQRFAPSLKPGYKWKENITLEAEFGQETTTTTSPTTEDKSRRRYWSLGYRWDF
jgi:tetratricopeptide (TPR) repeat protein